MAAGGNDPSLYERLVLPDYAHLDALLGARATEEVFPLLLQALDRHAQADRAGAPVHR